MCGIAGYVDFGKSPQRQVLISQLQTIAHRGPDSRGVYLDNYAALGIQRLSIIDLKTGDQPISNEDGSLVVVYNGEIYNYQLLKEKLLNKRHIFKTQSDTETLVHLYEEYGDNMPKYLNGMFAFALWDKKKHELLIARDHVGVKPLFYFHQGSLLIFASEIKAILAHPNVKKEINPQAVAAYAQFGYIGVQDSIFKKISRLMPGTCLRFSKGKVRSSRYWSLSECNFNSRGTVEELLFNAVKLQSNADVPLGVFISGGLDSSLLLYYLSQYQRKKIHTFSVGFVENSFDETHYAKAVATQLKSNHHQTYLRGSDLVTLIPEIMSKLDEPLADPSLIPTYKVSQLAKKYVKVVLSGDGGDELFGGYPTYQGHLLAKYLSRVPPVFIAVLKIVLNKLPIQRANFPLRDVAEALFTDINTSPLKRHLTWMKLLFANSYDLLRPEFKITDNKSIVLNKSKISTALITQIQTLDFETYLRDDLLVKADRASMLNSLELRVPYLDLNLIQCAFSLRDREKVDLWQTKKPLRLLAQKHFPEAIWARPKKGFGIPLIKWLKSDLVGIVDGAFRREALFTFFERKKIYALLETHRKTSNYHRKIWQLTIFSEWLHYWYRT